MSVKVSSWVWHEVANEVNGNELVMLLALADVSDDNGRCRFLNEDGDLTYDALAQKVRVSKRTIVRLVESLRDGGLVEHTPGSRGRPNDFRIIVPWAQKNGDKLAPKAGNAVTTVHDSVTDPTLFGDNSDTRSSIQRIDVVNVGAAAKRGARITANWKPSQLLEQWAQAKAPSVDLIVETENFVDYWIAKPGASAVKLDWDATWRTWIRRTHERNVQRGWNGDQGEDPETAWMRR